MSILDLAFEGKPLPSFIIDAHTHLSPYFKSGWHQNPDYTSVESLIRVYDELGVNCCVTAPHPLIDSQTVLANEIALEAARAFPGRIYGYISVAPFEGMDVLRSNLKRFAKEPCFVGLKFLGSYNGDYTEDVYRYATDFAQEAACPILCHTWGDHPSLALMCEMAKTHPDASIISAHLGGGSRELTEKAASLMADTPNFHLELCGSLYNELGIEDVVSLVGEDRVIFGTDAINLDPRFDFGRLAFAPLSDEIKEKIFSGNYLRLLEQSHMGKIHR